MSQSSDTPETRKPCRYCGCLEASAKDWAEIEPGKGEELGLCWDGEVCRHDAEAAIDRLVKERDDLQSKLSTVYQWIERHHQDGFTDSLSYWQNLEKIGDKYGDRIDDAERQRDAAREEATMWRSHINTCLQYPRGSEAQVRCLEEVGQDAAYYDKQLTKKS